MKSDSREEVKKQFPWKQGLFREASGVLSFADRDLGGFLTREARPGAFYLLSLEVALSRARAMHDRLKCDFKQNLHFHFAMKSNFHPELLAALSKAGWGVDLVSGGELDHALKCGFQPSKVVFSGVAKSAVDIEKALTANVGQLNVESLPELQRITRIAKEKGQQVRVAIRINPEVRAETHPYIATGFRENKFGVDLQDFPQIREWLLAHPKELSFQGLSLHIGSQLTDFAALEEALEKTLKLEQELELLGLPTKSLDVGGGVGISYRGGEEEDLKILENYARSLKKALGNYPKDLHFEPGRFWVARAGVLVARVEYVKKTLYKNFLILNTGMNALMRPALYEAYHRFEAYPVREGRREIFDVVGPVCESSDVLGSLRELTQPQEGDFLIIGETGAYGKVLSSDYNLLGEVPELIWESLIP